MGRKRVTRSRCHGYRSDIYRSLGQPFLPPSFFFCLPDSREPSFLTAPSPPTLLHLASLPFTLYMYPVPAYHLVLPVPLSLYLGLSCINPVFSLFPPHRDFQLALACCSPFTRCVSFFFLSYTHNSLLLCIGINVCFQCTHA